MRCWVSVGGVVWCHFCGLVAVFFGSLVKFQKWHQIDGICENSVNDFFFVVVRLNGETPIKYGLRLNSEAKYIELKEQLSRLCNIKTDRLLLAELAYSQMRQILSDEARVNPGTATELHAYELPDNSPKGAESEDFSNDMGEYGGVVSLLLVGVEDDISTFNIKSLIHDFKGCISSGRTA